MSFPAKCLRFTKKLSLWKYRWRIAADLSALRNAGFCGGSFICLSKRCPLSGKVMLLKSSARIMPSYLSQHSNHTLFIPLPLIIYSALLLYVLQCWDTVESWIWALQCIINETSAIYYFSIHCMVTLPRHSVHLLEMHLCFPHPNPPGLAM